MPYLIRKLPNKNKYRVKDKKTGRIMSYGTSKKNAEAQVRLLMGVENNPKFAKKIRKKKK